LKITRGEENIFDSEKNEAKIYITEKSFNYPENSLNLLKARVLVPSEQKFFLELKPQIEKINLEKDSSVILVTSNKNFSLSIDSV